MAERKSGNVVQTIALELYGEMETPLLKRTSMNPRPRLAIVLSQDLRKEELIQVGARVYAVAHYGNEGSHIDGVDLVQGVG